MCERMWAIIRGNAWFFSSQQGAASGISTSLLPVNEKGHACEILKVDINIEERVCVCVWGGVGLFFFLSKAMTVL